MASLESSQWLHKLYGKEKGEQKCLKKFPYKWKHAYLYWELLFISLSPFMILPNLFNYNIFDEFVLNKL
jgi:hypothetical protein